MFWFLCDTTLYNLSHLRTKQGTDCISVIVSVLYQKVSFLFAPKNEMKLEVSYSLKTFVFWFF